MHLRWAATAAILALVAVLMTACGGAPTVSPTAQATLTPTLILPFVGTASPSATSAPVGAAVGQRAPDFTLSTIEGGSLTRDALLDQGRPFLLYFYTTW